MLFLLKSFFAEVKIFIFRPKTMDYSLWFDFRESKKGLEERLPSKRVAKRKQNKPNFSFVAPSSEKLRALEIHSSDDLYHACTFERDPSVGAHNSSLEGAMKLKFVLFCSP